MHHDFYRAPGALAHGMAARTGRAAGKGGVPPMFAATPRHPPPFDGRQPPGPGVVAHMRPQPDPGDQGIGATVA